MAIGKSGRIVIEIDPLLKRRLRAALELDDLTLKDWFVDRAIEYIENHKDLVRFDYGPLFASKKPNGE